DEPRALSLGELLELEHQLGGQIAVLERFPHRSPPRNRLEQAPVTLARLDRGTKPNACKEVTLPRFRHNLGEGVASQSAEGDAGECKRRAAADRQLTVVRVNHT